MPDDRFSEDEIRRVFERAAADYEQATRRSSPDGLTVGEMAEVGEASGIPRAFVEAAARAVRLGEPEAARGTLGPIPTSVRRTALLAEPPSDALWERLVADARRTFDARGTAQTVGRLREWRNGNLVVTLEPAGEGSRLEVRSRKSDVQPLLAISTMLVVSGVFVGATGLLSGEAGGWVSGLLLLLFGLVNAGIVAARQRSWAGTREAQMAALVERASAFSAPEPTLEAPALPMSDAPHDALRLDLDTLDLGDDATTTGAPRRRTRL